MIEGGRDVPCLYVKIGEGQGIIGVGQGMTLPHLGMAIGRGDIIGRGMPCRYGYGLESTPRAWGSSRAPFMAPAR